jgi:hypothetical protein
LPIFDALLNLKKTKRKRNQNNQKIKKMYEDLIQMMFLFLITILLSMNMSLALINANDAIGVVLLSTHDQSRMNTLAAATSGASSASSLAASHCAHWLRSTRVVVFFLSHDGVRAKWNFFQRHVLRLRLARRRRRL